MSKIISFNPSNNYEVIGSVDASTKKDVEEAVKNAHFAQIKWADLTLEDRCKKLESFVQVSINRADEIAILIAKETGRPLESAKDNVKGGITYFNDYLKSAKKHLAPKITLETDTEIHRVYREPLGVVACICPWNYPFMNVVWQCGQALIAGNTVVYKNSEENPLFAKLLAELFAESDVPGGVFNVVYGDGKVGEWLVESEINMISFTGSTKTGRKLTKIAGDKYIPIVTELGGSAPMIVLDDIEVTNKLIEFIWSRRFKNAGQACDAVKRLIVHKSKFNEIVNLLRIKVASKKMGNALNANTDIGPLISKKQLIKLEKQVKDAKEKGAKIIIGGNRSNKLKGSYYEPTLIIDVNQDMKIWQEEVFGPVLPIISFDTDVEAINLANDTEYGLGAHVMTNNKNRFTKIAKSLKSGMVAQNEVMYWHPSNPFGGYKHSGMGRIHGEYGFNEVTQVKLISEQR